MKSTIVLIRFGILFGLGVLLTTAPIQSLAAETDVTNLMAKQSSFDAVVSADGSGTHTNIQSAIAAAPDNGTNWFTILVKPGVYQGQFMIPKEKHHVRIVGEEMEKTVLTWPYNVNDRKIQGITTYQFDPGLRGSG